LFLSDLRLTWVGRRDHGDAAEVARPGAHPHAVVVGVEGVRRVRLHGVRLVARLPLRQRGAVHLPGAARPVQRGLQHLRVRALPRHAVGLVRRVVGQQHAGARQVQGVRRDAIHVEQAPVLLRCRPRPGVLVVQLVDVGRHGHAGVLRCAGAVHHVPDEVAVVGVGVVGGGVGLGGGIALVRPPGLSHHHRHVGDVEVRHGKVGGVHDCIEDVGVVQQGVGVHGLLVRWQRPEQRVVQRDDAVGAHVVVVGVHVEHEWRPRGLQELEHGHEHVVQRPVEEGLRRREGVEDDGRGVRRGDLDVPVQRRGHQRVLEVAHGWHEQRRGVGLRGEHLGPHGDGRDVDGGEVRGHIARHPVGRRGVGVADGEQLLVGYGDDDADAGVGERRQHRRVGVVEADVADVLRAEQRRDLRRRRHRRHGRANVHADVRTCTPSEANQ
jgi:hypothetical protein